MILVFDVGNTTTAVGAYDAGTLAARWRLHTSHKRSSDEYGILLGELLATRGWTAADIEGTAIACVVPQAEESLVGMCRSYLNCEPVVVTAMADLGMKVFYNPPQALGADRIVNALAAASKYGMPVIVVDLGTATKFEAVSADAEYLGGVICPGVGISLEALSEKAAKLPRIDFGGPVGAIAQDTVGAIRFGIVNGTVSAVDGIIRRIKAEMGTPAPIVVATGGYAGILAGISNEVQVYDDQLTLDGLFLAHQRITRRCTRQ